MDMELREMRYILEIYRRKNMTHAANSLYISQPALHKMLKKIEAEYETELFYREGRELIPTDTGMVIIEKSQQILKLVKEMENRIISTRDLKNGELSIGFPSVIGSIYLPEILIEFQSKYPGIRLNTVEKGGANLLQMTEEGELDMAIVMGPIYCDGLNEVSIINDRVVVCVHESHPWADRSHVRISDFKNTPFVTFTEGFNVHKVLTDMFREEKIVPHFALTGIDSQFLYTYAIRSNNILVLPEPMIRLICGNDSIRTIPFSPAFPWNLVLIYRKNAYMSSASRAMISHIESWFYSE